MVDDPSESSEADDDTKPRKRGGGQSGRLAWARASECRQSRVAGRCDAVFESRSLLLSISASLAAIDPPLHVIYTQLSVQ
jgi:hypothetical protein